MSLKRNLMCISLLSAPAISLSLATGVQAATSTSSQAFVNLDSITADESPTGNINTATDFTDRERRAGGQPDPHLHRLARGARA